MMRHTALTVLAALALASCSHTHKVYVTNDADAAYDGQLAEMPLADVRAALGADGPFVLLDSSGAQVPYQITYDSLVVFPVTVAAASTAEYTLEPGQPVAPDTVACGALYPRRKDDLTWENDRSAFRAYGPALQATGERAFGYDIWTKSVGYPVVAKRYSDAFAKIANLHEDNGNGMDQYGVGPTLGAGTAALLDSAGAIVYPWCFDSYEILDNGPLRFTVRLTYPAAAYGTDSVRETRLISLDKGEYLNRTTVSFDGLTAPAPLAPGIVVHRQNPDGFELSAADSYMAYADPTQNPEGDNGIIYVGIVAPEADSLLMQPLADGEADAAAHLLARSTYRPADSYTYYWGSGWSKGSMPDWQTWKQYLTAFGKRIDSPLKIQIK